MAAALEQVQFGKRFGQMRGDLLGQMRRRDRVLDAADDQHRATYAGQNGAEIHAVDLAARAREVAHHVDIADRAGRLPRVGRRLGGVQRHADAYIVVEVLVGEAGPEAFGDGAGLCAALALEDGVGRWEIHARRA